ncbi:uncharacterized protein LOC143034152 [Oratosquilla oratoria]|uniref:uncharacterized protein LOC143034152 n=1 Tax=Oratosquilla oratoria TaxID=337810 RepID=UPI003F76A0A4
MTRWGSGSPQPTPRETTPRRWFGWSMAQKHQYNPNSIVLLMEEVDKERRFLGLYRFLRWVVALMCVGMAAFLVVTMVTDDVTQTARSLVARFTSSTGAFSIFKARGFHVPDP